MAGEQFLPCGSLVWGGEGGVAGQGLPALGRAALAGGTRRRRRLRASQREPGRSAPAWTWRGVEKVPEGARRRNQGGQSAPCRGGFGAASAVAAGGDCRRRRRPAASLCRCALLPKQNVIAPLQDLEQPPACSHCRAVQAARKILSPQHLPQRHRVPVHPERRRGLAAVHHGQADPDGDPGAWAGGSLFVLAAVRRRLPRLDRRRLCLWPHSSCLGRRLASATHLGRSSCCCRVVCFPSQDA